MNKIKVLYAVTECVPFVKTGGLADVAGILPQSLNKIDCDVRVILPNYEVISFKYKRKMKKIINLKINLGDSPISFSVERLTLDSVTYYFITQNELFQREGLYGYFDDSRRFAFLNKAVIKVIPHLHFIPNILHINDWHYGLIPLYLKLHNPYKIKSILSIHNLQYQGVFDKNVLYYAEIKEEDYQTHCCDQFVNFIKCAIMTSDLITTVSKTYALEITTPEYGEGLSQFLMERKNQLYGILNGIDLTNYNPKTDDEIKYQYSHRLLQNKKLNKAYLQEFFGLPQSDCPIVGIVSRLVHQKGFDLLKPIFDDLMNYDFQLVVLGSGLVHYEKYFNHQSIKYPNQVKTFIGFNTFVAQIIYAGCDFILIPSLFEPCGLTQMIAMRYGTIPIVRETGGLKDSVEVYNEHTLIGNGFGFKLKQPKDLYHVMLYAFEIYQNKEIFSKIIDNAMKKDFSFHKVAHEYKNLYLKIRDKT